MTKEKATWLAIGIVAGIVLRSQIDRLPFVSKIPTV